MKAKKAPPPKKTSKRKNPFKGTKKTCMVGEESLINLMLDMAPYKKLEMIEKIISKLSQQHKKRLLKKLGVQLTVSTALKKELKKIM